jgi:hypothetical protein
MLHEQTDDFDHDRLNSRQIGTAGRKRMLIPPRR